MNGTLRHTTAAITSAVLAIQVAISIPGAPLSALVLSFMVYGFAGWLWESTVCAMLNHGSFSNSGFLLGPCCPIYGVGALVCWFALRGIENVPVQFLAAGVLCCCIEYLVGVILEVTTHARFLGLFGHAAQFSGTHMPVRLFDVWCRVRAYLSRCRAGALGDACIDAGVGGEGACLGCADAACG